ncbi:MAG: hypothetical protein ACP5U1_00315 [Desulfomonilaceae bacterium]
MRGGYVYLFIGLFFAILIYGSGEVSIRSFTCKACHQREAKYVDWMAHKLKIQNKGFSHELIACADCHIAGSPQNTVLSRGRALLHAVTYLVPQIDPRQDETTGLFRETRVPTANCEFCHYAAIYRKAVYLKDLTKGLKEIGLAMDHRKHVIARDDTCAKCHERYKDKNDNKADKEVNYAEVNHLACDSCHSFASHYYLNGRLLPLTPAQFTEAIQKAWNSLSRNPRWMVAIPTEQSCRRCHNGKIHYKTRIFVADCREGYDYKNCVKCHPMMTKDYFDRYLEERQTKNLASESGEELILTKRVPKDDAKSDLILDNVGQNYGLPGNRLELNFPNSKMNWSGEDANSKR